MFIKVPKADCFYLPLMGLSGPHHVSGEPFETIQVDDPPGSFDETPGIYGQNSVVHHKVEAELIINSYLASDYTTALLPLAWNSPTINVRFKNSNNGSTYNASCFPEQLIGTEIQQDHFEGPADRWGNVQGYRIGSTKNYAYDVRLSFPKNTSFPYQGYITYSFRGFRGLGNFYNYVEEGYYSHSPLPVEIKSHKHARELLVTAPLPVIDISQFTFPGWFIPKLLPFEPFFANVSEAKSWLQSCVGRLNSNPVALPSLSDFGDLAQAACENVNPNTINAIAFLKDLRDVKSLVPKLKKLSSLSTHAGNYLGVEYGVLPTLDDLKNIWESFRTKYFYDPNGFQRASAYDKQSGLIRIENGSESHKVVSTVTRRLHLAINTSDTGLDALTERLRKIGIFPSLTNLWDLVPYSFVVDWFIDVGSVLERIDTRHQLFNLDIKYCILSEKSSLQRTLVNTSEGYFVDMLFTSYRRDVTKNVPQPRIFKENRVTAQNHWIEGSALILARHQK